MTEAGTNRRIKSIYRLFSGHTAQQRRLTTFAPDMATFYLFPQLAPELRRAIWRNCLPYRTLEIDIPIDCIVFDIEVEALYPFKLIALPPCKLHDTTYMNLRPPLISRVCRESRDVAFETGRFKSRSKDRPDNSKWVSMNTVNYNVWEDPTRDSYHLNWSACYNADYGGDGNPLGCLAWNAAQVRGGGSMMVSFLDESSYHFKTPEMIEHLGQLPSWLVVMRVVVVHADLRTAAATGLFGLLGDERVQLVDVSEKARIDDFFDLGTKSGCSAVHISMECLVSTSLHTYKVQGDYSTDREDLNRDSVDAIKQRLRDFVVMKFGSENKVPPMHPAIMFRLCTSICNVEEIPPPPITKDSPRGRGRVRGRGGSGLGRGRGGV